MKCLLAVETSTSPRVGSRCCNHQPAELQRWHNAGQRTIHRPSDLSAVFTRTLQVKDVFWSKTQAQAREHGSVRAVLSALNRLWKPDSLAPVDLTKSLRYESIDRLTIYTRMHTKKKVVRSVRRRLGSRYHWTFVGNAAEASVARAYQFLRERGSHEYLCGSDSMFYGKDISLSWKAFCSVFIHAASPSSDHCQFMRLCICTDMIDRSNRCDLHLQVA